MTKLEGNNVAAKSKCEAVYEPSQNEAPIAQPESEKRSPERAARLVKAKPGKRSQGGESEATNRMPSS